MKNLSKIRSLVLHLACVAVAVFMTLACTENKNQDSKEIAEEMNEDIRENDQNAVRILEGKDDSQFLVDAAEIYIEEVSLGKLAQIKSDSPTVIELGKKMENEHSKSLTALKSLAASKEVVLPDTETQDTKETIEDLNEETGVDFEKEYSKNSVQNHEDAIKLLEKAAEDAEDPEIRNWASQNLAILKNHLRLAEACKEEIEKQEKSTE